MFCFFDLDGTLFDLDTAERNAAMRFRRDHASRLETTDSAFADLWRELSESYMARYLRGELSHQQQRVMRIQEIFGRFGHTPAEEAAAELYLNFAAHYEDCWELFPDVAPCFEGLQGVSMGIVTNGQRAQQLRKIDRLGLGGHFQVVVTFEDVGEAKPSAGIFREAIKRANVTPADCLYVGDKVDDDVLASCAIGMHGVLVDRNKSANPTSAAYPVIRSLIELPELLRNFARQE